MTVNVSGFYIDWTNQQIKSFVAPGVIETTNAGKSHSQGFELEASWRPMPGLELSGFVGLTHGVYDECINQAGADLSGHTLVNTPVLNAGLAAQYRWPLIGRALDGVVRAEYLFTGDQYFDAENRLKQEGYGLVNLRVGVENERFSATLFANNLFDQDYRAYGYQDFVGYDLAIAGASRVVGLTAKWRY